ncbi:MAG: nucleotide exchange factor GrpE [Acidobacteriota bacterium]
MTSDRKQKPSNSIPIRFFDGDDSRPDPQDENMNEERENEGADDEFERADDQGARAHDSAFGGPELAELIASRAELKRLQAALTEAQEAVARRQADFENYRKRIERERSETQNRVVAEAARKLLPVVDNLARALDAERSAEASESKEFKHFLHGVELISKQLNELLESFGVQPIAAVGERFDPHIHEAVATEASGDYEPDTVTEELARGYRIGDRLLRPAMVKVAARQSEDE